MTTGYTSRPSRRQFTLGAFMAALGAPVAAAAARTRPPESKHVDHGRLQGLADDEDTQYFLRDQLPPGQSGEMIESRDGISWAKEQIDKKLQRIQWHESSSTPPLGPNEGAVYYNTETRQTRCWVDGVWVDFSGGSFDG